MEQKIKASQLEVHGTYLIRSGVTTWSTVYEAVVLEHSTKCVKLLYLDTKKVLWEEHENFDLKYEVIEKLNKNFGNSFVFSSAQPYDTSGSTHWYLGKLN